MYVIFDSEQGVELAIEEGVQPRPCYVCMVRWAKGWWHGGALEVHEVTPIRVGSKHRLVPMSVTVSRVLFPCRATSRGQVDCRRTSVDMVQP